MKCFMKLNNDLLLKKFFFKVIAIKKYFLPLLSIIIISCGGEDDSVEVPTPKFLENNDQKVYADGSGTNETDYMFFYNNHSKKLNQNIIVLILYQEMDNLEKLR